MDETTLIIMGGGLLAAIIFETLDKYHHRRKRKMEALQNLQMTIGFFAIGILIGIILRRMF